jgi:hypothetical protein
MKRFAMYMASGLVLFTGLAMQKAKADEWNKQTKLTVNQPVSVDGVVLSPGQYIIQLAESQSTRTIVQIFNADNDHLVATFLGNSAYREKTPDRTVLTYYEAVPGASAAVREWYYPGDNFGIQFNPPNNSKVSGTAKSTSSTNTSSNTQPISASVGGE